MYLTAGIEIEIHNANRNQLSVAGWQDLLDHNGYGLRRKVMPALMWIANLSCHHVRRIWQAVRMTTSACFWNLLSATVAASRNQVAACMFILATARFAICRRAIFGKLQRRHTPRPIVATTSRPTWQTLCRSHWSATLSNAMPRIKTI